MELGKTIGEALKAILGGRSGDPTVHTAGKPADPQHGQGGGESAPALTLASAEFAERLRAACKASDLLAFNGMQIIGLGHVSDHFDSDWPKMADKVKEITRQAIERRLGADDFYASFGEMSYVIIFANLPTDAAKIKCALIADEISKRIFGEAARPDLVQVATSVVDTSGNVTVAPVDLHRIIAGISMAGGAHEVDAPGAAVSADAPGGASTAEAAASEDDTPPGPIWKKIKNDDNTPVEAADWAEARPGEGATATRAELAEQLRAQLPPREKKIFDFGPLHFVFRPMWLIRKKITSALICIPSRVTSEGTIRMGGAALLSSPGSEVNAEYDMATIQRIHDELELLAADGITAVLIAPVHFITISHSASREKYIRKLKEIPEKMRKGLVFEIIAIPRGAPQGRLLEVVSTLKAFASTVLVRTFIETRDFTRFVEAGVYGVGADLTNFGAKEEKIIQHMEKFAAAAEKFRLRTYVHGLRSNSLVSAAVCAGIDYIDGDPITSVVDQPRANANFGVGKLYESLVNREFLR